MTWMIRSIYVPVAEGPGWTQEEQICPDMSGLGGAFRYVAQALAEGWEPFTVTSTPGGMVYHLRRPVAAIQTPESG